MSVTNGEWTDPTFGPGELYGAEAEPETTLSPYRVTVGDKVYDQSEFTGNYTDRNHAYIGGVGSGKTIGGMMRVAANVEQLNPGHMGAIVTPNSLQIKNAILPKLQRWGFFDSGWEYHGPQSAEPGLHTPNGTRILLESANNERKIERLRGYDLAWFWLDEAAYVPKNAWDVLQSRLRIGDYRNSFITTTPAGQNNWVYHHFHPDGEDTVNSLNLVQGVPSYANPHLPLDYRKEILGEFKGQHREQEVEGSFVTPEGLVYPWFDRDTHVVSSENIPDSFDRFMYGVDWGFHPHPASMHAIGVLGDRYYILEEHYETRNTTEDLADVFVGPKGGDTGGWYDRYGRGPVYCDPSEPANIEQFKRRGIQAKKADNDVEPGIQHVTSLADDIRVHEVCQGMINEFNQYQYKDNGDPKDEKDHAMDGGLRYPLFTDTTGISAGGVSVEF